MKAVDMIFDRQVAKALADPVFDPTTQISSKYFWLIDLGVGGRYRAGLTVNIGME